jgi:hypothetical protein
MCARAQHNIHYTPPSLSSPRTKKRIEIVFVVDSDRFLYIFERHDIVCWSIDHTVCSCTSTERTHMLLLLLLLLLLPLCRLLSSVSIALVVSSVIKVFDLISKHRINQVDKIEDQLVSVSYQLPSMLMA